MSCRLKTSWESRIQVPEYSGLGLLFLVLKMEIQSHQDKAPGHT